MEDVDDDDDDEGHCHFVLKLRLISGAPRPRRPSWVLFPEHVVGSLTSQRSPINLHDIGVHCVYEKNVYR